MGIESGGRLRPSIGTGCPQERKILFLEDEGAGQAKATVTR